MVAGEWTVTKPSRSDDVLDADQQLQITNQVSAQFEAVAPKRPAKPNRSESDPAYHLLSNFPGVDANHIPELDKLRSLQKFQSPVLFSGEGVHYTVEDEFVETGYYKEMEAIDKQHHTTGTGFIKVAREEDGDRYGIELRRGAVPGTNMFPGYRSNPATNDWTPSLEGHIYQVAVSSKPNRSESS